MVAIRRNGFIIAGLLLLTIMVFHPVVNHEFLYHDDDHYVTQNPYVFNGISFDSIKWAFTTSLSRHWHPVTWMSHMLDGQLFGLDPMGHHLTSLVLHCCNTLLVYLFLLTSSGARWKSCVVAALFAVHPLHVESVAWVADRKDLLACFFFLLSLLSYVHLKKGGRRIFRGFTVFFFVIGLMSKPSVIVLPVILLLLDVWPLGAAGRGERGITGKTAMAAAMKEKLGLFVLSIGSGIVTILALLHWDPKAFLRLVPGVTDVLRGAYAYGHYLLKTVWPADLTIRYPEFVPTGEERALALASLVVLTLASILIYRTRDRFPWLFTGWFWFAVALLPVCGFIRPGPVLVMDRYTYIPHIGLFTALVWGGAPLVDKARWRRYGAWGLVPVLTLCLAVASSVQVSRWKDNETLFTYVLSINPNEIVAHTNLGKGYFEQGDLVRARYHFEKTLQIDPQSVKGLFNMASLKMRQGEIDEAIDHYFLVLSLRPDHAKALNNLAVLLARKGRLQQAAGLLRTAIDVQPDLSEASRNLSRVEKLLQ
jgi:hypothetical protein